MRTLLLMNELDEVAKNELLSKLLIVNQRIEKCQTLRENQHTRVLGLFPIPQILQIVHEGLLCEVLIHCQVLQVPDISKVLDELEIAY